MAVLLRDGEVGEDDREDEDVVDRQAALDQVAGEIRRRRLAAAPGPNDAGEADCKYQPDRRPDSSLTKLHLLRPAVEDE